MDPSKLNDILTRLRGPLRLPPIGDKLCAKSISNFVLPGAKSLFGMRVALAHLRRGGSLVWPMSLDYMAHREELEVRARAVGVELAEVRELPTRELEELVADILAGRVAWPPRHRPPTSVREPLGPRLAMKYRVMAPQIVLDVMHRVYVGVDISPN